MNISKCYSSYKFQSIVLKLLLNFSAKGPHKTVFGITCIEILSSQFLAIFFFNFKFTIVAYREAKNSIIWTMSDRRAKLSGIWNLQVLIVHIWCTFDLVAFKVILGSFGALTIFRDWALIIIRNSTKYFSWL